jgi:hypothetical protein
MGMICCASFRWRFDGTEKKKLEIAKKGVPKPISSLALVRYMKELSGKHRASPQRKDGDLYFYAVARLTI